MPFTLIKGRFMAEGFQPDGDSIRFLPKNFNLLKRLPGNKSKLKAGQSVQLRFEAIDAVEIHYSQGHHSMNHQPDGPAKTARDFLLKKLGMTVGRWTGAHGQVAHDVQPDGAPGYILSRTFEGKGRPVSFVFAGSTSLADGANVHLTAALVKQSLNFQLMKAGGVYPTYYTGLFYDLRAVFTAEAKAARARKGKDTVWQTDKTQSGVKIPPIANVVDKDCVLPKLFRRLSTFFKEHPSGPITKFKAYLAAHADPVWYIPDAHSTHLDTYVVVKNGKVSLSVLPEDLIFEEKA